MLQKFGEVGDPSDSGFMPRSTSLAALGQTLARIARWAKPYARRSWANAHQYGRALLALCGSGLRRHRTLWLAAVARVAWWSSLAWLVAGLNHIVDLHGPFEPASLALHLISGLIFATVAMVLGRPTYFRWSACGLAVGHAGLAMWLFELVQ